MSAAVILNFPAVRTPEVNREAARHVGCSQPLPADKLATVRLDVRHSLLLLDIAVFRLRNTAPPAVLEWFAQELATIDKLLDAARAAARNI